MTSESNQYTLKREFFGQTITSRPKEDKNLGALCFKPDTNGMKNYEYKNPKTLTVSNFVEKCSHTVKTEKIPIKAVPIKHIEGGWPEYVVNNAEPDKVQREMRAWVRTKEKSENFEDKIRKLISNTNRIMKQNQRMDIYEEYFEESTNPMIEDNFSAKIKMVFKDTEPYKRNVTKVAWNIPEEKEEQNKIAVAYRLVKGQDIPPTYKPPCLVWDMDRPNAPINILSHTSEIVTVAFNKHSNILGAGCANGTAVVFDLNTNKVIGATRVEDSHSEPISDFVWLKSKNSNEFVTSSTDGSVIWWEIKDKDVLTNPPAIPVQISREPDKPLFLVNKEDEVEKEYGGTKIENNTDAGATKFLFGTEQGIIFVVNKKKTEGEIGAKLGIVSGRHLGPIVGMQRNPHHFKYILTVGDWTARIWTEDLKFPIFISKYHPAYLTDCVWTPRVGMFLLSRTDGWINAYDLCYKTNEVAFSQKVSEFAVTTIALSTKGDKLLVGDEEGKVSLLKLSKSFYALNDKQEMDMKKSNLGKFLEREQNREKNLTLIKKVAQPKDDSVRQAQQEEGIKSKIKKIEAEYFGMVGDLLEAQQMKEDQKEPEKVDVQVLPQSKLSEKNKVDPSRNVTMTVEKGKADVAEKQDATDANMYSGAVQGEAMLNESLGQNTSQNVNNTSQNLNRSQAKDNNTSGGKDPEKAKASEQDYK